MKETNSVPAWEEEAKPDEVLVQTSTGLFKFQGNLNLCHFYIYLCISLRVSSQINCIKLKRLQK